MEAEWAGESSLPLSLALRLVVAALVNQQEASLTKGLVAAGASVAASGLAAGRRGGIVAQAMGRQFGGKRERFGAVWARVGAGFGGMVRVAVGRQLGGVAEGLGAIGARVGTGGRVGPEMRRQLGAVAEGLGAVRAGVRASSAVREAVRSQLGRVGEGLGTVGTRVRAGAAVR